MRLQWWWTPRPTTFGEVASVLQAFLADETDQVAARRVARHLHDCIRCGMEAATYERIKARVRSTGPPLDPPSVASLRRFGEQLAAGGLVPDGGEPRAG